MSQDIPAKGERQFLLFADAVRPNTQHGFIPMLAFRRGLLDPGQDVTHRYQTVSLETGIEQHLAPIAQVFHRVRLHIGMLVLQTVKVSCVILVPLPFQQTGVFMEFALLGAEQKQIGFAWTLGIRHHNFRRDDRLHDDPLYCAAG
jgi:hypothetical protein